MTPTSHAVVLGATGAVGAALTRELLASPAWTEVIALTRRPVDTFAALPGHEKLKLQVIDLKDIESAARSAVSPGGAAFCTIGLGQPRKASREEFWRVDVEYPGAFARGAAAGGVGHISLLSSVGADLDARSWYLLVKGAAEAAVVSARIRRTSLFRPSLLVTQEIRYGLQDRLTQALFPWLSPLLPRQFHQITVEQVGRAMRINAERRASGVYVLHYQEMVRLLGKREKPGFVVVSRPR